MNYIGAILEIMGSTLSLWSSKEKNKYTDQYLKLQRAYLDETSKERPDHNTIDRLERDLLLLSSALSAAVKGQAPQN